MKEYIISVIAVAALGSLANGICPEGEGQGLKKAVSFIMSLMLIAAVGKPLISFVAYFDSGKLADSLVSSEKASYEEVWTNSLQSITASNAESAVKEMIAENFDIKKENISVKCVLSKKENAFTIEKTTVELFGTGIFTNPRRIESFLAEKLGCECVVKEG